MKCHARIKRLVAALALTALSAPVGSADFQADGVADIAWRDKSTGAVTIWRMNGGANGGTVQGTQSVVTSVPLDWAIHGIGDLNGDRVADLVWRNETTGTVGLWAMSANGQFSAQGNWAIPAGWRIEGVGDFNGDGKADILWRYLPTGYVALWLMNGGSAFTTGGGWLISNDWVVQGVGDFNGDGKADVLWRMKTTGRIAFWLTVGVSGSSDLQYTPVSGLEIPSDWVVQGIGDFNGDGRADILWRQGSLGPVSMWFMNGATIQGVGQAGTATSDYVVQDVADFNGDGKADILWRLTSDNSIRVWLMNGATVQSSVVVGTQAANIVVQPNAVGPIKLAWDDNSTVESGFIVERSLDGVGNWMEIGRTPANTTTFVDATGSRRVPYYYRVKAYDAASSSVASNVVGGSAP